jgi:hypothetical protein
MGYCDDPYVSRQIIPISGCVREVYLHSGDRYHNNMMAEPERFSV